MTCVQSILNAGKIANLKRTFRAVGLDKAAIARIEAGLRQMIKDELIAAGQTVEEDF